MELTLSKTLQNILSKKTNPNNFTRKQKEYLFAELTTKISFLHKYVQQKKEENPFFYYEPTRGVLSDLDRSFLEKYLKPDDIPEHLDGGIDIHLSSADVVAASGGNQSGKSTLSAVECYIKGTGLLPYSLEAIYPKTKIKSTKPNWARVIAVDDGQLLNTVIPTFRKWVPKNLLTNYDWVKSFTFRGREGQKLLKIGDWKNDDPWLFVEFMTNKMDIDKFQGPRRDQICYDEEPKEEIYKENLMRFATAERLDILLAFTPTKGLTWATELFDETNLVKGKRERYILSSVNNPYTNRETLRSILDQEGDYETLLMRLLGEFISLTGFIYRKHFKRKIHIIEPFEVSHEDFIIVRGIDLHITKPSVCVDIAIDRENIAYVIGCYKKATDIETFKKDLHDRAKQRNYRLGITITDSSIDVQNKLAGDINLYQELVKEPYPIPSLVKSKKFPGSISVGINMIKKRLNYSDNIAPSLYFVSTPEVQSVINAILKLEIKKDDITNETLIDEHAALRYTFQRSVFWYPISNNIPKVKKHSYI